MSLQYRIEALRGLPDEIGILVKLVREIRSNLVGYLIDIFPTPLETLQLWSTIFSLAQGIWRVSLPDGIAHPNGHCRYRKTIARPDQMIWTIVQQNRPTLAVASVIFWKKSLHTQDGPMLWTPILELARSRHVFSSREIRSTELGSSRSR